METGEELVTLNFQQAEMLDAEAAGKVCMASVGGLVGRASASWDASPGSSDLFFYCRNNGTVSGGSSTGGITVPPTPFGWVHRSGVM
jgi:hypothetical protein